MNAPTEQQIGIHLNKLSLNQPTFAFLIIPKNPDMNYGDGLMICFLVSKELIIL